MKHHIRSVIFVLVVLFLEGCSTHRPMYAYTPVVEDASLGAIAGGAVGFGLGVIAGAPFEGAVVGSMIGAGAGVYQGTQRFHQDLRMAEQANMQANGVTHRSFTLRRRLHPNGRITADGGTEYISGKQVLPGYMNIPYQQTWSPGMGQR